MQEIAVERATAAMDPSECTWRSIGRLKHCCNDALPAGRAQILKTLESLHSTANAQKPTDKLESLNRLVELAEHVQQLGDLTDTFLNRSERMLFVQTARSLLGVCAACVALSFTRSRLCVHAPSACCVII